MSGGQIAALIAACAFVLLVGLLAVPLLKLGRTLDEATLAIRKAHDGVTPILTSAQTTVDEVNGQLKRVDGITADVASMSSNAAAITSLVASTVGGPLVKVASFSYGIRKAAGRRHRGELERDVKAAQRQERKERKAAKK